jgi:hypothetical protein
MAMVFKVNLATIKERTGHLPPYDINESPSSNFPATRSTWFPDKKMFNRHLTDGQTFTVSGLDAVYIYNNLTTGPYAFLTYVSGTAI